MRRHYGLYLVARHPSSLRLFEAKFLMNALKYSMSFTTGGLFLAESVLMASSFLQSRDWQSTIEVARKGAAFSSMKPKSMQRAGREIANRLTNLDDDQLAFLVETPSRTDQAALLWLAICRTYRLIREFAVEVIVEKYEARQKQLSKERYDSFVHDKGEGDAWLAARSASTIERSRQVVFKMMREAGVLDDRQEICRLPLSPSLRRLLANVPQDHAVFPGGVRP